MFVLSNWLFEVQATSHSLNGFNTQARYLRESTQICSLYFLIFMLYLRYSFYLILGSYNSIYNILTWIQKRITCQKMFSFIRLNSTCQSNRAWLAIEKNCFLLPDHQFIETLILVFRFLWKKLKGIKRILYIIL